MIELAQDAILAVGMFLLAAMLLNAIGNIYAAHKTQRTANKLRARQRKTKQNERVRL